MNVKQLFLSVATTLTTLAAVAQTDGFSYQAVVRDSKGELVKSQNVSLLLTIADSAATNVMYSETQTAATNDYGVLSVTVGRGTPQDTARLANVDWSKSAWLHIAIDTKGGNSFAPFGATKIQAVPLALYALNGKKGDKGDPGEQGPEGPAGPQVPGTKGQTLVHDGNTWVATDELTIKKLDVTGKNSTDEALFEVKDKDGNVVFAVYSDGVHVYVDEAATGDDGKAKRSGFVVTGRPVAKGGKETDYLVVNPNGTHVYIDPDDTDKAKRSGFVVTGRPAAKDNAADNDFFTINADGTHVYIDTTSAGKAKRSGFVVTGRKAAKGDAEPGNYFSVSDEGTRVYIDTASADKAKRSGFVVTGRKAAKDGAEPGNYFSVSDEGTKVFVDDELESSSKAKRSGFVVTGRKAAKDDAESGNYMKVATDGTKISFDESATKAPRSGLIITGRPATKGAEQEYMTINTDSTRFYIDAASSAKGFAVSGREDGAKDGDGSGSFGVNGRDGAISNLFNIDLTTSAETLDSVNRIYWYPAKNAFMAGNLKVEHPDSVGKNSFSAGFQNKSIGQYSQAMGYKSRAKGDYTTAIGRKANAEALRSYALGDSAQAKGASSYAFGATAQATGENAVAIGNTAKADNNDAYAFGYNAKSTGLGSYAIGTGAEASGQGSFAFGSKYTADFGNWNGLADPTPRAKGPFSYAFGPGATTDEGATTAFAIGHGAHATSGLAIAIGAFTTAANSSAIAIGREATASGDASIAMGFQSTALGYCSFALGKQVKAYGRFTHVIGMFNVDDETTDKLFVVGNGTESGNTQNRSDALIVYKDGNMTVNGNITHTGTCEQSDFRLKKDIQPLDGALDKVLKLRGVSFYWKTREEVAAVKGKDVNNMSYGYNADKQIGVIAQEVEEILPELVVTDSEGFKSVKYENLTPVLIEAVKEQQKEIEELKAQNLKLQQQMEQILQKLNN